MVPIIKGNIFRKIFENYSIHLKTKKNETQDGFSP